MESPVSQPNLVLFQVGKWFIIIWSQHQQLIYFNCGMQVKWLYYPAYALVIVGIFVYLTTYVFPLLLQHLVVSFPLLSQHKLCISFYCTFRGKDESIDDIVDDENPHLEYHILKEENVDVEDCTPQ